MKQGITQGIRQGLRQGLGPHGIGPTAAFTHVLGENRTVQFTDASTAPGDATIESWSWTFGDGNTSTLQSPEHTYASADTYTVTLEVTDSEGRTASTTQQVLAAIGPTAGWSAAAGENELDVDFTNESTAGDSAISTYEWTFGDSNGSSDENPSHTYPAPDTYTPKLVVTDGNGLTDEHEEALEVPVASVETDGPDVFVPTTSDDWNALDIPPPTLCYPCQESGGDLSPSIGSSDMEATGSGHLYEQSVSSWGRSFVGFAESGTSASWQSPAYVASSGESLIVLAYASVGGPGDYRGVIDMLDSAYNIFVNSSGQLSHSVPAGFNEGSEDHSGLATVRPVMMVRDADGNFSAVVTDIEKIVGAHDEGSETARHRIGDSSGQGVPDMRCGMFAVWRGSDADALISAGLADESLLTALGWTVSHD